MCRTPSPQLHTLTPHSSLLPQSSTTSPLSYTPSLLTPHTASHHPLPSVTHPHSSLLTQPPPLPPCSYRSSLLTQPPTHPYPHTSLLIPTLPLHIHIHPHKYTSKYPSTHHHLRKHIPPWYHLTSGTFDIDRIVTLWLWLSCTPECHKE